MSIIKTSGSFNRDKPTITEEHQVAAAEVVDIAREFLGGVQYYNGNLVYFAPAVHSSGLVCMSVGWSQDWQQGAGGPYNSIASMTVEYGIPDYNKEEEESDSTAVDVGSFSVHLGGEFLELPTGGNNWTTGSQATKAISGAKPFKLDPVAEVEIKFNSKAKVDLSLLQPYYGTINDAVFTFPGQPNPVAINHARYDGAEASRKWTTQALEYYEITHKFSVATHSWNKLFCPETGEYEGISRPPYDEYDWTNIFRV